MTRVNIVITVLQNVQYRIRIVQKISERNNHNIIYRKY